VGVFLAAWMLAAQVPDTPWFVHRISITGNTVTHDAVVRRELGLVEGGLLDLDALRKGLDRLNQLGYFKPIAGDDVRITPTPGAEGLVDVELRVTERRDSRPAFGGGTSQNGGVFGSVGYTTPNLLGRGRTVSLLAERGSHDSMFEATVADPHLFGSPTTGSIAVSSQSVSYPTRTGTVGYSETRKGATVSVGRSKGPFARVSFGYTYEIVDVAGAADSGRHVDGRVAPAFVYDTVDDGFLPHRGVRFAAGLQVASPFLGGHDSYIKPEISAVWYRPATRRSGFGIRGQAGVVSAFGGTADVPSYLRYFLGGESQIRGVDVRTVGPIDSSGHPLGGTSFVLFNLEYHVDLANGVRVLAFHDAGQAFADGQPLTARDLRTSSGIELRVVIPKLNVPLRFIYYWNLSRDSFQPAQGFGVGIGAAF
jgi:outer membrane protein insertion porin family